MIIVIVQLALVAFALAYSREVRKSQRTPLY